MLSTHFECFNLFKKNKLCIYVNLFYQKGNTKYKNVFQLVYIYTNLKHSVMYYRNRLKIQIYNTSFICF